MDKFLNIPTLQKHEIFREASTKKGLSTIILEKDFWVCWTLKQFFNIQNLADNVIFKGGTSLSKCYGLIERFSEDCDLTINKKSFSNAKDPTEQNISQKEQQRRIASIVKEAENYIREYILPTLSKILKNSLGDSSWDLELCDDQLTILFHYPSIVAQNIDNFYVKPTIKLELGARGGVTPAEDKVIRPYITSIFPDLFTDSDCIVPTLSAKRTFWEKITILHSLFNRHLKGKVIASRMSRHYYDVYMFTKSSIYKKALQNPKLLEEVVRNNMIFFKDSNSSQETAILGRLKLLPSKEMLINLRQDYKEMEVMMIGEYPAFDEIMEVISNLEKHLNSL
jgi:hypothetical protein